MSTRLAPAAACIGTFVVLMHLTTAGVVPAHRAALPRTGPSHTHRVVGVRPPAPAAVLLRAVCGPTARWGVAAAP
ncbi:hypothetical protein SGFS_079130 [Streptomyces graminofaciens]|uniref:Secreted protein n=1 Tax=Streptomyces graminofaciens TaxID=68212 RepID=A0ABM7FJD2_9ACTN|nr:hypothetical protein [Streptomyces graminofaciens]BBC36619.1 hypothetical protein SGFS_079130 [Streptomyces graminofaciens]